MVGYVIASTSSKTSSWDILLTHLHQCRQAAGQSILDSLAEIFEPGIVITADPMYYIYCNTLERKGFSIVTVPEDNDGIKIDILENVLNKIEIRKLSFIYIATVNNPSCTVLANSRKKEIVRIAEELSEKEEISPEFLEQIFFRLRKSGIIKSTRGPGGGFQIDRDPRTVSVKEIFDAVGEEISLTPCTSDTDPRSPCERNHRCIAHEMWIETAKHINDYFSGITIQDILDKNVELGVVTE